MECVMDVGSEHLYPLTAPAKFGCDRSWRTVHRWWRNGLKSKATGKVVKLEAVYVGGTPCTSREAFHRFINELNGN